MSVSSGTLNLRGAITEDGTVAVSSGAEFGFDGTGTTDLASTSVISGYGTVEYGSGTINAGAGTYDVPGPHWWTAALSASIPELPSLRSGL